MTIIIFVLKGELNGENHSGVFLFFVGYIADNCKKLVHIFILKCSRSRMVSLVIYWVQLIQHFVTVIIDAANPLPAIDVCR